MVAKQQELKVLDLLVHILLGVPGKGVLIRSGPDPLDLPAGLIRGADFHGRIDGIAEIGDVVDPVAGRNAFLGSLLIQLAHVDHHGPSLGGQGFRLPLQGGGCLTGPQQFQGGIGPQPQ